MAPGASLRTFSIALRHVNSAGIVNSLQDMLADKVGSWVTVIIGAIFVLCVMAFRKGVVGEIQAYMERRSKR